jgi:putative iron-dependent peroxidase
MSVPQAGIIPEPSPSALFLVLRVKDPARNASTVAKVAGRIPSLANTVGAIDPRARLVCTMSFGSEFWDAMSPGQRPMGLRPFTELVVGERRAPSTGGDVLVHILSRRHDLNFELATWLRHELGDTVSITDEVHGFRYLDSRDLTGFIDGTENPKGEKTRAAAALIGKEDPPFAGGSYVFTQRYVHDLQKWARTSLKEQEGAIGRRKRDSQELSPKATPDTAHISRVVIEENGEELQIVRHSFPYGTVSEAGLFFVAYSKTLDIPEKMLARMVGATGDGKHDHLLDFTQAVTGATFFAPSLQVLKRLGKLGSRAESGPYRQ